MEFMTFYLDQRELKLVSYLRWASSSFCLLQMLGLMRLLGATTNTKPGLKTDSL
jgi:hypothetical protein